MHGCFRVCVHVPAHACVCVCVCVCVRIHSSYLTAIPDKKPFYTWAPALQAGLWRECCGQQAAQDTHTHCQPEPDAVQGCRGVQSASTCLRQPAGYATHLSCSPNFCVCDFIALHAMPYVESVRDFVGVLILMMVPPVGHCRQVHCHCMPCMLVEAVRRPLWL